MRFSTRTVRWWQETTFILALAAGGGMACQGEEDTQPTPGAQSETINVYWTAVDESTGKPTIKHQVITKAQADEITAARARQRLAIEQGASLARSTASTIGATDWQTACGWWDWFLVKALPDSQGDMFCGHFSTEPTASWTVQIPFTIRSYESSSTHWGFLCWGDSQCGCREGCGPSNWFANTWLAVPPGMTLGNINPPDGVNRMNVGFVSPF